MARRSIYADGEPMPLSIGARRMLLQDALKQMRKQVDTARAALTSAEKTLIFLEAQWNDDSLMKARANNAKRTGSIGS